MRYVRTVAPAVPVVTADEARAQGIGRSTDADTLVEALVAAATEHLDGRTGILGRALVNQTWRLDTAEPDSCGRVRIDMPNVSTISSIATVLNDAATTWSAAQYRLGSVGNFHFVEPRSGYSWPSTDDVEDAIRVTFVTGFGATAADVPTPIRQAIILLAKHLYGLTERNLTIAREEVPGVLTRQFVVSEAASNAIGAAIKALTDPYRIRTV